MPLNVSFTFETTSTRQGSPSVRFMPNGTIELWRERAMFPKLELTHTSPDYAMECVGTNYLLWSVIYDSGEPFRKCKRCPDIHTLGWKRKHPPQRIIEYGEEVDGFVPMGPDAPPGVVTHTNSKYYSPDVPSGRRPNTPAEPPLPHETYPVVRYRDLAADGSRQFKAFLSCNSHFHGHHLFHIKVQLVELNAAGQIIRAEVAYSPRIKVVSKFLEKKGSKALPVADVRKFLSMESVRKRRKLANLSAIASHTGDALPAFPTADSDTRRRKIPKDMTQLAAEQDAALAAAAAAAQSAHAAAKPFPTAWSLPPAADPGPALDLASPAPPAAMDIAVAPPPSSSVSSSGLLASRGSLCTLSSLNTQLSALPMNLAAPGSAGYSKALSPASKSLFSDPMLDILKTAPLVPNPPFSLVMDPGASSLTSSTTTTTTSSLSGPGPASDISTVDAFATAFNNLSVQDRRHVLLRLAADPTSWQVLRSAVLEITAQNSQHGYESD